MSDTTSKIKTPVTFSTAMFTFYDIESLSNVFTLCAFTPRTNVLDIFYLVEAESVLAQRLMDAGGFDERLATTVIAESNPAYHHPHLLHFHDLATVEANVALATMFGLSSADVVNDKRSKSDYPDSFRLVCDTDPSYDPINKHPYLAGYNSFHYDTTMLAAYFYEAFAETQANSQFQPASPAKMRQHNDQLFEPQFRDYMAGYLTKGTIAGSDGWSSRPHKIRQAMIDSGRHIDIARLNEKQQRVGLKRLLGMLGHQILESDKLGGHNAVVMDPQGLYELLAYNVSDVVYLHKLAKHPSYSTNFDLKKSLLDTYPETIYDCVKDTHTPDVTPWRVRRGRLTPDSSSAKFVATVLSPYGNLEDIEAVSFLYPSQQVADQLGIERVNVLDELKKFFHENISNELARLKFEMVYQYYKSIEGRNFNDSEEYRKKFPNGPAAQNLADIPKLPNNLPYFRADGTATSCFATFSTGGIHGAEADERSYELDLTEYGQEVWMLQATKDAYPDPKEMLAVAKAQAGNVTLVDDDGNDVTFDCRKILTGITTGRIAYRPVTKSTKPEIVELLELAMQRCPDPVDLLTMADLNSGWFTLPDGNRSNYKKVLSNTTLKNATYRDTPARKRPQLFVEKTDGSTKLHPKYVHTSVDEAIHEDFASYYPLLLSNMSAFYNPDLGADRYLALFHQKESLGKQMKAKGLDPVEKERLGISRAGVKLLLNSASGVGDAGHKTSIRMNNTIISMRIIGQIFSFRIGQAQTLAGARIISTNTDGLYSVLDEETNNSVLATQAKIINVDIEPEPMILVSKDSNNRLEIKRTGKQPWDTKIIGASGGSLSCHKGPNPEKSLAHPAIMDFALAEYLRLLATGYQPEWADAPLSITDPFDLRLGRAIIERALNHKDPVHAAMLFQNILAASTGSITYPFAADDPASTKTKSKTGGESVTTTVTVEAEDTRELINPRALQHYNRVFVVKPGTPGAVNLRAAGAWKITDATAAKRRRAPEAERAIDTVARNILFANGWALATAAARINKMSLVPEDQDVVVRKINGIDPSWPMLVLNKDLHHLDPDHLRLLLSSLDLDIYLQMAAHSFETNWRNRDHAASRKTAALGETNAGDGPTTDPETDAA